MKIVLVGASGYVGGELLEQLSRSFETIGLSRNGIGKYKLDLEHVADFDYEIICEDDFVVFTSAISSPDICENQFEYAYSINVKASKYFIDKCLNIGARVIFFSSDTVYGERNELVNENSPCNPVGAYGIMKHEIEKAFISNIRFKSLRLSYIFSDHDKFTNYITSCAQNGLVMEVFHPFIRNIIVKEDVLSGVKAIIEKWNLIDSKVINFGGPISLSRVELVEMLKRSVLLNLQYSVVEPGDNFFKNRPRIINMDSSYLKSILNRELTDVESYVNTKFVKGNNL